MSARCLLCHGASPLRFRKGAYAIHRCARCDLEFVWPTPSPDELRAVYERGYFSGDGAGYDDYFGRERAIATRKSTERLGALASLGHARGRLLDFGAAAGYFVDDAHALGWESYGCEPSPEARAGWSESMRPRLVVDLEQARDGGPFDVITAWDVLEHLPDPLATLRTLRSMLRPGGVFAVVTPVLGSINTRLAPTTWDQYKPPEHLWFFSRAAMRELLHQGAGATVLREETAWRRAARFIDPEGISRAWTTRLARQVDIALHRVGEALRPELTVDSVAFYARVP